MAEVKTIISTRLKKFRENQYTNTTWKITNANVTSKQLKSVMSWLHVK